MPSCIPQVLLVFAIFLKGVVGNLSFTVFIWKVGTLFASIDDIFKSPYA